MPTSSRWPSSIRCSPPAGPAAGRRPAASPAGQQARDDLARATLARLDAVEAERGRAGVQTDGDERRCARLLRERLEADLAMSSAGENLRAMSNIFGPGGLGHRPPDGAGAAGSGRLPRLARERRSLQPARRARAADVPPALRADLDEAAAAGAAAVDELRRWLTADYLPQADGTPDAVGEERYRASARTGPAPTSTRPRPTNGAGRSTSRCWRTCARRRSGWFPARPQRRPGGTWTPAARSSREPSRS